GRLGELRRHLRRQRRTGLGWAGAQAQGPYGAARGDRLAELDEPRLVLLFDPPVQTFAEAGRQLAGLVVASRRIGRHHDRPEVAEIELVEVGEGGIGP